MFLGREISEKFVAGFIRMLLLFMGDWRRLIKTEHEPSNRPQREPNKSIMKIIIVGGVAGGASAAARARRLDGAFSLATFDRRRQKFYLSVLCISSGLFSHPRHFTLFLLYPRQKRPRSSFFNQDQMCRSHRAECHISLEARSPIGAKCQSRLQRV